MSSKTSAREQATGSSLSNANVANADLVAEERVKSVFTSLTTDEYDGWSAQVIRDNIKLVTATSSPTGRVVFEFVVGRDHVNKLGSLHGGCTATLFDVCTTVALAPISKPGFWSLLGVSRTLNVTYLRPMAIGETVLIEGEVIHAGKRLCVLKGTMKRKADGAVTAICEHNKVSIDPEVISKL